MVESCAITCKRKKVSTATAREEDHAADHHDDQNHPPHLGVATSARMVSVWTEEMHSSFLHTMEAAFVHDILFGRPAGPHLAANHHRSHLQQQRHHQQQATTSTTAATSACLDRYVPDCAESTRDRHRDSHPPALASASFPGMKRRRKSCNVTTDGCISVRGISTLSKEAVCTHTATTTRHHPLAGPPNEARDDAGDQVVPLFEMATTQ